MKISLMTLNMVGEMFFKFQMDQDFDGFAETYDEMLDLVKECGYSAVDVTAMETTLFRPEDLKAKLRERGLKVGSYIYMAQLAAMDKEGFAGPAASFLRGNGVKRRPGQSAGAGDGV